jgi:hypothetical protein
MKRAITPCLALAGTISVIVLPLRAHAEDLTVSADTPTVVISTRPAGRNFMRLPDLDYRIAIDGQCPTALAPGAISISIADTRIAVGQSELAAADGLHIPVTVPASQIGPVAVGRFCTDATDGDDGAAADDLRIPAVLSAQVSLLCTGEADNEMTYAATSLDVILHCEAGDAADDGAPIE